MTSSNNNSFTRKLSYSVALKTFFSARVISQQLQSLTTLIKNESFYENFAPIVVNINTLATPTFIRFNELTLKFLKLPVCSLEKEIIVCIEDAIVVLCQSSCCVECAC